MLIPQKSVLTYHQLPNNQYIIVFNSSTANKTNDASAVNYKITTSPENTATERTREIITTTSALPRGASYVTWSSVGGANGTIILSDSTSNSIFFNQALGEGQWKVLATPAGRALGREARARK